jgi:hypothetical protein
VAEFGGSAGLPNELAPAFCVGKGSKCFDGDGPVEAGIERLIDDAHPAFTDLLQNAVVKDRAS